MGVCGQKADGSNGYKKVETKELGKASSIFVTIYPTEVQQRRKENEEK